MPLQTPCICSVNVNGRGWHSLTGVACPLARELELPEAFLASTLRTTLTSLLCPVPWLMVGAGNIKSPRLRKPIIQRYKGKAFCGRIIIVGYQNRADFISNVAFANAIRSLSLEKDDSKQRKANVITVCHERNAFNRGVIDGIDVTGGSGGGSPDAPSDAGWA
uniref:Uncharacterized protein n=1 Tax=Vespula pensylvanica TaxID=30213 RepID=A0A834P810_VESPE|nr:hypothetical protein H0235_004924 [Vespula pensylvanica]